MRSAAREKALSDLVKKYDRLIASKSSEMMRRYSINSNVTARDLYQAGVLGLISAFDTFDESKGVPFEALVATKITYAILQEIFAQMPVPLHQIKKSKNIEKYVKILEGIYGRQVTDQEMADFLNISEKAWYKKKSTMILELPQFDDISEDSNLVQEDRYEETIIKIDVDAALQKLTPIQRTVIDLLFFQDKSMTEAGEILGKAKQRIFEIKESAFEKLREFLKEKGSDGQEGDCSQPSKEEKP